MDRPINEGLGESSSESPPDLLVFLDSEASGVLGAGGGSTRQKLRAANSDCSLFQCKKPPGAGLGLREPPPGPGLPLLATVNLPAPEHCRLVAQAHLRSTASHYCGDACPRGDGPGASWCYALRQGKRKFSRRLRPHVLNVTPAPLCLSPPFSLDVGGVHGWAEVRLKTAVC